MFKIVIIGIIITLAGCETVVPTWQQELNNLHRNHRVHDDPVKPVERPDIPRYGRSMVLGPFQVD